MLAMGKSKPWPEALEKLTGSKTLDVTALTEYFRPLTDWMKEQREELGYAAPGWDDEPDVTPTTAPGWDDETDVTPTAGGPALVSVLFNVFALLFALVAFFW